MEKKKLSYLDSVHRDGKIWGFIIFAIILSVPFILMLVFNTQPNWNALIKGLIPTLTTYWPIATIEIFTFIPMLGAGGSYLSFVTGNISNLKLPCALDALEKSGYSANSEEGEIISTIAISVSSIVTTFIIIIGVIALEPLKPILQSEVLTAAFDQLLPALFGGLAVVFIAKNLKLSIPPLILMLTLFIFVPALNASTVGIMVPVGVVFTIVVARIMYKKGWI